MKKFTKLGKNLFVFKSWQSFVVCLATSSVATLLFSFQFQSQSKVLANSPYNNITNVKSDIKVAQVTPVTRETSSCARVLVETLQQYMKIERVQAKWKTRDGRYYTYYETASNEKSLQNYKQSVKQKAFPSYNFLVSSDHSTITDKITTDVRNAVHNDGAKLEYMEVSGTYYSDGNVCYIVFDENQRRGGDGGYGLPIPPID